MHLNYGLIPAACLFVGVPALASSLSPAYLPVPPASFLNYHVSTVRELSQEVTIDPTVRGRLANHFHVTEAQMTRYIRENLVLTHLKKAGYYRVACVGRSGREYWIESRLPAGTAVFASRATGRPILKLACGNPMVSSLPPTQKTADSREHATPPRFAFLPPPVPGDSSPMPGLIPSDITPTDLIVADTAPAVIQVSPSFEGFTNPGGLLTHSGGSFNFIPALVGIAAIGIAGGHHGGSTPLVPPVAVPETSTSISLGLMLFGGAAFLAIRRKRVEQRG